MDIRSDRKKGMGYTEIGRKYHIDPRMLLAIRNPCFLANKIPWF